MNETRPSLSPTGSVPRAEATAKRLRILMVIVLLGLTFIIPSSATSAHTVQSVRCADLLTVLGHTPPDSLGYQRLVDLGAMLECGQVTDYTALVALYLNTDGDSWLTKTDWLSDSPYCGWYGVDCDLNGRVFVLCLADNQLSGPIPLALRNLSNLRVLSLSANQLSGSIPPELADLSNLRRLSLGGNQLTGLIPPELGTLSSLQVLNLSANQLSGPIPPELGTLINLRALSLNDNHLTGPIPPQLGNLSKLGTASLYNNQPTGSIPPQLGNLSHLGRLNLSGNQLSGTIPPELGSLGNLVILDLRFNRLSGPIPTTFGNLSRLWFLTLTYNDASLCVPAQDLLDFFLGLNFYEGPDLCLPSEPTWAVPICSC